MIKKVIKYTDYEGNERSETYWFNLSKAELVEMQTFGSLRDYARISDTQDTAGVIEILKDVILRSYGEKSSDGKRFVKTAKDGSKLSDTFAETEAYSELFMELATNPESFQAFIKGVIPAGFFIEESGAESTGAAALMA